MPMLPSGSGPASTATSAAQPAVATGTSTNQKEHAGDLNGASEGQRIPLDGGQGQPAPTHRRFGALASATRTHWLAVLLIAGGVVFRVITEFAYRPAIIYIDTLKYLYGQWPGSDPVAYKVPLKLILAFGNLETVALVQHLLGLGIAITIYVVLMRRGVSRWLGALAIAPVLFDAYQLQVEAMIMPDIWFEATIVAGLAVLLWRPQPTTEMLALGAFILGASTGVREVGEVFIVPVLILVVAMGGGWRKVIKNVLATGGAFGVALLLYMGASYELTGHFWISRSSTSLTYGRMASVVDCATLKIPAIEQPLCPSKSEQAMGPDWLEHNPAGPYRMYASRLPASVAAEANTLTDKFNRAVESQQPLRVISGITRDSVKLFAVARYTSPGDTPIWRWQFQGTFPSYLEYIHVQKNGIYIQFPKTTTLKLLNPAYGGPPVVIPSLTHFLRTYQLNGGYTPGPLLLLFLITGLIGSVLAFTRKLLPASARQLALVCLGFFVTGVAVLGASDVFEFSWRYQIPALVTLPPAGAIAIGILISMTRRSGRPTSSGRATGPTLTGQTPAVK